MDWEGIINLIIVAVFIGVALAVKLIEAAAKRKASLRPAPGPAPGPEEEEVWPELEVDIKPKARVRVQELVKIPEVPEPGLGVAIPEEEVIVRRAIGYSRDDLEKGIIFSTILGPPRCTSRWRPFGYQ